MLCSARMPTACVPLARTLLPLPTPTPPPPLLRMLLPLHHRIAQHFRSFNHYGRILQSPWSEVATTPHVAFLNLAVLVCLKWSSLLHFALVSLQRGAPGSPAPARGSMDAYSSDLDPALRFARHPSPWEQLMWPRLRRRKCVCSRGRRGSPASPISSYQSRDSRGC